MLEKEVVMTPVSLTSSDLANTKQPPLDRAKQLAKTLLSERSQASGAKAARQLHELLGTLDASDRQGFQRYLATEFQPDADSAGSRGDRWRRERPAVHAIAARPALPTPDRVRIAALMQAASRGRAAPASRRVDRWESG